MDSARRRAPRLAKISPLRIARGHRRSANTPSVYRRDRPCDSPSRHGHCCGPMASSRACERPVMSRSRPRVVADVLVEDRRGAVDMETTCARQDASRASSRRAKSTAMVQSARASPGGAIAARTREMRRSELVDGALLLAPRRRRKLAGRRTRRSRCWRRLPAARRARRGRAPRAPSPGPASIARGWCTRSTPSSPCRRRARRRARPRSAQASTGRRSTPHSAAISARCPGSARSRCADSEIGEPADFPPSHRVGLAGERERPRARLSDLTRRKVQVDQRRILGGARRRLVESLAIERQRRPFGEPARRGRSDHPQRCRRCRRRLAACIRARPPSAHRSPRVCASTKTRSMRSSHSIRCSMP